jgi:hypothetical protein
MHLIVVYNFVKINKCQKGCGCFLANFALLRVLRVYFVANFPNLKVNAKLIATFNYLSIEAESAMDAQRSRRKTVVRFSVEIFFIISLIVR